MRLWLGEGEAEPIAVPLAYGESMDWNGARLTAYPAGHILGAAQLLIEYGHERIVYSGDIKLRRPLCGAQTEVVPCDRLIVESTFGLPIFRLLDREAAVERMVAFARECFNSNLLPAFIGYALGRGQEIVHVLSQAGIRTAVHGAIARFLPVYQEHGYDFAGWEPYDAKSLAGKALVVVPTHGRVLEASGKNVRLAYVSGWAALDNARARSSAEELIPYSDHADFDELLALIEGSGAGQVDLVHGYTDALAHILRSRGINAHAPLRQAAEHTLEAEG
jgi:Cft2 family RNA processing exonuclease